MYLLHGIGARSTLCTPTRLAFFIVETRQDHPSVVKAAGTCLVDPNLALFLLVVPDAGRLVTRTGDKGRVGRIQIDLSDHVGVPDEGAQNVVVVQAPVHYPL